MASSGPAVVLGLMYVVTAVLTNSISNSASVVLMIPVAVKAAFAVVTTLGIAFFRGLAPT